MKRRENWRVPFFEAIEAHRPHRFAWGTHDCAILTADAIAAITGVDLAAELRGRYSTREEADELLKAYGYGSTVAILAPRFDEIPPALAIVGDVAIVPTRWGPATAPVVGSEIVVFSPGGPMGLASIAEAVRAFRIEIKEGRR